MTEEELDRQTYPLREAMREWARVRGWLGFSGGYARATRTWEYRINVFGRELSVSIDEDGKMARVSGRDVEAPTPRKLKLAMNRWERENGRGREAR